MPPIAPSLLRPLAATLLIAAAAPTARAWSPATQAAIAADAARLAPPDLAAQLERHAKGLAAGAGEPFRDADPARHVQDESGGKLVATLNDEVDQAIVALRTLRPFSEVVRRLGRVSHWAADLDNPLNASSADAEEGRYFRNFFLYAESARPRFAVVLYENAAVVRSREGVELQAQRALARSRSLYPLIGREYRRIGFGDGRLQFDDRSTAFGVAALAYSHAVSDAARLFRHIWIASGGVDPREVLDRPRDRVVLLPQSSP